MGFQSTKYYPIALIPKGILDLYSNGISEEDVPEFDEPLNLIYRYSPTKPTAWRTESYKVFNFWTPIRFCLVSIIVYFLSLGFSFFAIWFVAAVLSIPAIIFRSFPVPFLLLIEIIAYYPYTFLLIVSVVVIIFNEKTFKLRNDGPNWWTVKNKTYELTEEEIKEQDNLYEIRKQEYDLKKLATDKQNAIIKMQHYQKCSTWKHDSVIRLILEGCRPYVKAKSAENAIKKGRSENYFEDCLRSVFGDKIHANQITEDYIFYPDLVYVCNETGIHIDIEIDEPYILSSREPIHYKHDEDENRNEYFIRNNWCVIRFTEEQVVEHTETCIEYIQEFVNHFKLSTFMQSNGSFEFPAENLGSEYEFYTKKWSEKKAKKLAKRNYREGYLGPAGLL